MSDTACSKHLPPINSFNHLNNTMSWISVISPFLKEETEVQRG